MITYEKVKELFHYNRKNGKLFWRVNRGYCEKGEEVGWFDKSTGYLRTSITVDKNEKSIIFIV